MLKIKLMVTILAVCLLTGCSTRKQPDFSDVASEIVRYHYSPDYLTQDPLVGSAGIEQVGYFTVNACTPFIISVSRDSNDNQFLSCWGFVDIEGETEFGTFDKTVYIQFDTDTERTILRNVKVGEVCDFFESFPGGAR